VLAVGLGCGLRAAAQANDADYRQITPSVFVAATGVETGLPGGRNLGVTAGLDVRFLPGRRLQPSLEYRGTYAVVKGSVDSQSTNMGGLKLAVQRGRLFPFVNVLVGRGETEYAGVGYQVPGTFRYYLKSSSNVYDVGGGADLDLGNHLALKVELQLQRYSSPVTVSGHLYGEAASVGMAYTFHLGRYAQ